MRYNRPVDEDFDARYRALLARDARFDGVFYVGVSTTGIYCRPICTARTPRQERCTFFRSAVLAEQAGFRACFRCRPEVAPGRGSVDAGSRLLAQAATRIEAGFLDTHSVDELAAELGVTARHLRRAMEAQLGVSPLALALSRRLAMAKRLLHDSQLGLAELALASGFSSVRRFNAAFTARFGRAPSMVRRKHGLSAAGAGLQLRLDARPPFDWPALLAFLSVRAAPGVEEVCGDEVRRVVALDGAVGTVLVRGDAQWPRVWVELSSGLVPVVAALVPVLRRWFDLDARPEVINDGLRQDRLLAPLVRSRPGLRVPRALDPFELVCRAVLGQQVSVRAATTLAGRMVARWGAPLPVRELRELSQRRPGCTLSHRFPIAASVASASVSELAALGLPTRRAQTLAEVARAFTSGALASSATLDDDAFARALRALPGIGDWTVQYVLMRARGAPDAFPASDLGVRKALGGLSVKQVEQRSVRWRPWRAYAAMQLWASLGAPGRRTT